MNKNNSLPLCQWGADGSPVSLAFLCVQKYCIVAVLLGALFFVTNVKNGFSNSSPTCQPSSFIFPVTMQHSPEILPPPKLSLYFFLCLAWRNTMSMRTEQRVSHICAFSLERLCRSGQSLYAFYFRFYKGFVLKYVCNIYD